MNLQALSTHPIHISNSHFPIHPKKSTIFNSLSGYCNSPKWVPISHKKLPSLARISLNPRFNLGFYNMSKRVSDECFGGDLMRVRCGGIESNSEDTKDDDAYYMREALGLARKAMGCTSPNPMVGCVIVKDGAIVGQGFHPKAGQPHAEVYALRDAGDLAENATAYVTLEPCNHFGKTPPCSEALIKAKVKKVVVGMVDPNPIVLSRGIDSLREAGIEVVVGVEEDSCKSLNEAFIHKMLYGKPFVAIRYSMTMNGALSDQLGERVTKYGGYYSKLLQEYDAVIHAPTSMTKHLTSFQSQEPNARQPLHILIAKTSSSLTYFQNLPAEGDFKAIVFADKELTLEPQMSHKGIEIVVMDHLSLDAILDYCIRQGFCNVLVDLRGEFDGLEDIVAEGIETNLVQKVVVEVLPFWGLDERSSSLAVPKLTQKKLLKNLSTRISGASALLEGYF